MRFIDTMYRSVAAAALIAGTLSAFSAGSADACFWKKRAAKAPATESRSGVLRSFEFEDSHFDFDKATLKPEGMEALRENIQLLKDNPKAKVRVAGYTSARGDEDYNQDLSERRAKTVADYLVAKGVAPGRISTIGFGETRPAKREASASEGAKNSSAAKSNMRVLFEITDN